jgi:nucleoside-diphosphate-sugar epimerase
MSDKLVIGCGYLGRVVAARWRAAGHRVFATTRSPERAAELRAAGLEPVVCDVLRPDSLRALPSSVETIVYCVGFDRSAGVPMRTVYIEGLSNVLTALDRWAGRFVHVSSTGVYAQTGGEEVEETAETRPPQGSTGDVVLEAERLLLARRPAVVLRLAGIYGQGRLIRAREVRAGEALASDPERWLNLIHVEDGAAAVVAAGERGAAGRVYNVCDDRPVRCGAFYTRLAELLGAPPPRFAAAPALDQANRRVVNRRMKDELGVVLRHGSYEEGLIQAAKSSSPAHPVSDE